MLSSGQREIRLGLELRKQTIDNGKRTQKHGNYFFVMEHGLWALEHGLRAAEPEIFSSEPGTKNGYTVSDRKAGKKRKT